jgi:dihydropyrimidinase
MIHMKEKPDTILIRGGRTVCGMNVGKRDILIQDGIIRAAGDLRKHKASYELDAEGLLVLPGAVDTHVHFNDEFMGTVSVHDFFAGTRAAAYGGVTSIIDFANQKPGFSLRRTLKDKKAEAEGNALVDWGVHPVITRVDGETLDEIPLMVNSGAPSIKCYMTYREEGLMMTGEDLRKIMGRLGRSGGMLLVHAEDNDMIEARIPSLIREGKTEPIYHALSRPKEAETRAVEQAVSLAAETGCPLFVVHMSAPESLDIVTRARREGHRIFAETCTHYLIFTEEELRRQDGIKWICSPPLRSKAEQQGLWKGIRDGRISMVTSDDAAYSWEAKLMGRDRFDKCPNGIPGIETRLPLLYSEGVAKNRISLARLVDLVSTTPAKLFGLWPRKGEIRIGADADIILFDPEAEWTMNSSSLHMAADWSAYDGIPITGRIRKVFSRGELIIDGEENLAGRGRGRFLQRTLDFPL